MRTKAPRGDRQQLIWERPEPSSRAAPTPLSRRQIVQAALEAADRDGLASVSLRRLGAALGAGPMRLYSYIATKEELLELMVDAVYGEIALPDSCHGDWRGALRLIAHSMRTVTQAHPWFTGLISGRPHLGPQALTYLEASFAALSLHPAFADINVVMQVLRTVNAYVIGALHDEASELNAQAASGLSEHQWRRASELYIHQMIATGNFPHIARVINHAVHLSPETIFDQGLDYIQAGISTLLPA
ncbi:TetR/AcrR family transcriptional regulator [Deinococcus sp.]|uniref:TetR/AcrR family transcriptional regulator n=1 Tax=Deinococcus sp. TaxID=47478 RepID=UPI003C7BC51F